MLADPICGVMLAHSVSRCPAFPSQRKILEHLYAIQIFILVSKY